MLYLAKYLLIIYIVVLVLYKLGEFTYFAIESAKENKWKDALRYAFTALIAIFLAWVCLSPFGFNIGPIPSLTDTAAFKWAVNGSVGVKWPTCAKAIGILYISAQWIVFAAVWRIAFKRVRRVRSLITQKQDKITVAGVAALCLATAAANVWLSKAIWSVVIEIADRWPDEPASLGKIAIMVFFALIWASTIVSFGVAAHKCIYRGRRRDCFKLLLSIILAVAISYVSWTLVPSF